MFERLKILTQYAMPKRHLTEFAGRVAASSGRFTPRLNQWFVARYGVDMTEAENPVILRHASFNDLFSRSLKPGARPLADAEFICPVDGAVSQFGAVDDHHIVQAKGHRFTTAAILGGDRDGRDVSRRQFRQPLSFAQGLSPAAHALRRRAQTHDPGSLFRQPDDGARAARRLRAQRTRPLPVQLGRPRLFRNDPRGRNHRRQHRDDMAWRREREAVRTASEWSYEPNEVVLRKGEEMGRFLLGSTIVMLFEKPAIAFNADWFPERSVRLGEPMGSAIETKPG